MTKLMWRCGSGLLGLLLVQLVLFGPTVEAEECFKSVFAFGDGMFDTGSISSVFPSILNYDYPPYGSTYFGKPSGRFSDGRLILDFLTESLGLPRIPSYSQTVVSDFESGVSFGSAFSTISTVSTGQTAGPLMFLSPFAISVQLLQFGEFRSTTGKVIKKGIAASSKRSTLEGEVSKDESLMARLPPSSEFHDGLYLFSTGAHDIVNLYNKNTSTAAIEGHFPALINTYNTVIKVLTTRHGVKNMIVFDVEPLGCQPFLLTLIPHTEEDVDQMGCLIAQNELVQKFNKGLKRAVQNWRSSYKANIVFLSQYDIKIDLLKDTDAGFSKLTAACCGVPVSPYNILIPVPCGPSVFDPMTNSTLMATACENPSSHLYWDGMYTTEAANRYVTQKIISGAYFDIPFESFTSCAGNPLT